MLQQEPQFQLEIKPEHRKPVSKPMERPSEDEEMVELKKTVGASLKTQLEKLSLNDTAASSSSNGKVLQPLLCDLVCFALSTFRFDPKVLNFKL